jgi:F0F1-type ATP synthase assembly protein I
VARRVGAGDAPAGSVQATVLLRSTEMAKKQRGFSYERAAKSLQENATNSGAVAGASYTLVGGIILLGAIGYGIDQWRGTSPWGVMIGLALGIIVGFYELVKTAWRR